MSKQVHDILARGDARIVEAPANANAPRNQVESDRNFGLPTALYGATVGCYLAFIGIMAAAFSTPGLIIPMVIFAAIIAAGFGVPALWTRLRDNDSVPMTMGKFAQAGIMTNTGRLAARDATIQMLILPVLIVLWACTVVVIAALV
ncbi:hypothetical protein FGU71_00730 [Erythrobacter insulae]|uniref:Uncharacterized protein n=1 Tax=Erythrobacter insulae TaxID=2584124 RepID=A0A547P8U8_9SPHN|nr:hypothetical protein [Erythrobacter insulae]TRD10533.1 hypothetical protein FGU71_00730 [Erythrobacter insulae]